MRNHQTPRFRPAAPAPLKYIAPTEASRCKQCGGLGYRVRVNSAWLLYIRTMAGVSRAEFAAWCGIAQAYVSMLERGRAPCTTDILRYYAWLAEQTAGGVVRPTLPVVLP